MKRVVLSILLLTSFLFAKNVDCVVLKLEGEMGKEYLDILKKYYGKSMNEKKVKKRKEIGGVTFYTVDDKVIKTKKEVRAFGKSIYIKKCQSCHGVKANKEPYLTSRKLIKISKSDFEQAINGYMMRSYDRGQASQMHIIADQLNDEDVESIYKYIQTLK